jgi:uncharacterized membrane protein YfcA
VPGAVLGAIVTGHLARRTFDMILGAAIIGVAVFILVASRKSRPPGTTESSPGKPGKDPGRVRYNLPLGILISLVVGFVSSLLGIGGGIIHVPALVFLLKFPVHIATATSHFVLAITAATGTAVHAWNGVFQHGLRRTAALAAGVVMGAQVGARVSKHAPNVMILRGLAVALIVVGVRIISEHLA